MDCYVRPRGQTGSNFLGLVVVGSAFAVCAPHLITVSPPNIVTSLKQRAGCWD